MRKGFPWTTIVDAVARLGLGGLFVYSGLIKILDFASFAESVEAYQMLPGFAVPIVAYSLPIIEWIVGVALIATKWQRFAAMGVLGLLMVFFVGLTQAIARGLDISCGCFGGDEGGRSELLAALLRDIGLMVPTVWLICRPDRWLFPWWRPLPGVLTILATVVYVLWPVKTLSAADAAALERSIRVLQQTGSTNVVEVEKWTSDFPQALARAREEKRPLVMFVSNTGCKFCKLLAPGLKSRSMETWTKGTGMYLAEAHLSETNSSPAQWALVEFLKHMPQKEKMVLPTVGIYWPDAPKGEIRTVFAGRRGRMPGGKHKYVLGEFFASLDIVLSDYLADKGTRPTLDEVLDSSARYIKVASSEGKVRMSPTSGKQIPGSTVQIQVRDIPKGKRIAGWKRPDGTLIPGSDSWFIPIGDADPEGTYSPVFEDVRPKGAKNEAAPKSPKKP
ncbi:MAG: MauE/DoxX family redox-associated membrane protein [Kiritimatiellia bacterium]